jgi:hypothetical protein
MIGRNFAQILGTRLTWLTGFEISDTGPFYAGTTSGSDWGAVGRRASRAWRRCSTISSNTLPIRSRTTYFRFGYARHGPWTRSRAGRQERRPSASGIREASNQVGTLKFDGLGGDYKYGKSASDRNPPRDSTIARSRRPADRPADRRQLHLAGGEEVKFKK